MRKHTRIPAVPVLGVGVLTGLGDRTLTPTRPGDWHREAGMAGVCCRAGGVPNGAPSSQKGLDQMETDGLQELMACITVEDMRKGLASA
jgi:hypothetical protein